MGQSLCFRRTRAQVLTSHASSVSGCGGTCSSVSSPQTGLMPGKFRETSAFVIIVEINEETQLGASEVHHKSWPTTPFLGIQRCYSMLVEETGLAVLLYYSTTLCTWLQICFLFKLYILWQNSNSALSSHVAINRMKLPDNLRRERNY